LQAIVSTSAVEMRDKTRTYSVPGESDRSRHAMAVGEPGSTGDGASSFWQMT